MKNFAIKKPLSKNQLDDLTDGLVNAMRYSNPEYEYPSFDKAKPDIVLLVNVERNLTL